MSREIKGDSPEHEQERQIESHLDRIRNLVTSLDFDHLPGATRAREYVAKRDKIRRRTEQRVKRGWTPFPKPKTKGKKK